MISSKKSCRKQPADGWSKKEKLHYHSLSYPILTELYNLTHQNGKFSFRDEWLKLLTPVSLLVWWLDDGSLVKNSRQGILCCEGFERKDLLILSKYLQERWKIFTHVGRRGKYYQLRIYSTEELKKFLRLILPYFAVPKMLPKVTLLYKDIDLQRRWISEVSVLTKIPRATIERYAEQKRKKWKNFRE